MASLALSPESLDLTVGQEVTLFSRADDAEGSPVGDAVVRFTSSDPAVAAVTQDGLVRAASPGSATVTATAGDAASTSVVRVAAAPAPTPDRGRHPRPRFRSMVDAFDNGLAIGRMPSWRFSAWMVFLILAATTATAGI